MMKILLNGKMKEEHLVKIQTSFPAVEVFQAEGKEQAVPLAMEAEVIVTWPNDFQAEFLQSPRLKWVHALTAGVDGLMLPSIVEGKVLLTNSRGIHGIPISEHVFALMLAFSRGLNRFARNQINKDWQKIDLTELRAKTLGIVGLGSIGSEIARLGTAFDMRVLAVKRTPGSSPEGVNRVVGLEGLEMVLRESDYLVLAVPLTKETTKLIGGKQLQLMKPTGILINVSRGEVVDEGALLEALEEGTIAGAGLDVFETEPLPEDSPLWQTENCIITPHCAALSPQYLGRATDLFCRNLDAFLQGEPMPTLVNPQRGY